ncbi:MAG: MBL fold metallo-hydrolase [Oscillospiraceae bacterium]|nr:MBL fold metallo-hydrolase [Oscillospiraceae bacterium]
MRITVLIENDGPEGLYAEHGLSLYIQHQGGTVLLDGGQSGRFADNAVRLGCDLETLDAVVLSHGHYDHADGLLALLENNSTFMVCARPEVMSPQVGPDGRYIGLREALRGQYAERFELSDEARQLLPGLWLIPDSVPHEQSLVAETAQGLVVMNSCCHAGAENIVRDILGRFPGKAVYALIGGLHLMGPGGVTTLGPSPDAVRALARCLADELGVQKIFTGHCTGGPAFAILKEAAPENVERIRTGAVIEI